MSEIKFYELKCKRCGGQLGQNGTLYRCESCGKTFEKQVVTDVADQLRAVLNEQKQEAVANLRQQLWAEMHEQYINSEKITDLARDIKKYLPDDYFANFCEVANSGNDRQVSRFLNDTPQSAMADYADVVLDFMLKSVTASNLNAISLFIERAFKGDTQNYDKYITKYEQEAQKVNSGIYELIITRDVFLAYSSKDMNKVLELCDYLERNKITCFLALRNLRHGRGAVDNYDQALKTAIDNCRTVVFVSSTNSRDMTCDALIKELPYIKKKDFENAPADCKRNYYKIPSDILMPRVQYLIEDYKNDGNVAEGIVDEFFHDLEWCRSKEEVARRVSDYLTETHETAAQRAERESREFQQQLEQERRKAEEERRKAKELEFKIAEAEKARLEAERRASEVRNIAPVDSGVKEDPNAKYCKKCRTANRKSAKFCSSCGSGDFFASFDEYVASKIKFCALCGAQNNAEDKFCAECGSKQFVSTEDEFRSVVFSRLAYCIKSVATNKQRIIDEERVRLRREEEERQRKIREEEERYISENFYVKNDKIVKYKGNGGEVVIPEAIISNGVTSLGVEAFYECKSLISVTIPKGITSIGVRTFAGCTALKSVFIPFSVEEIGLGAFDNCPNLNLLFEDTAFGNVYLEDERKRKEAERQREIREDFDIKNGAVVCYKGKGNNIIIPEGVTLISNYAFSSCMSVNNVIIPNGVTSIGESAFYNCTSLKNISIPNSVVSIGNNAFGGCVSLTDINIPDGVTSIGNHTFYYCNSLTKVVLGKSVTSIAKNAFENCVRLKEIVFKNEKFGEIYRERERKDLEEREEKERKRREEEARQRYINENFDIQNNVLVKYKGDGGDVTIPDGVTSIGKKAFSDCRSLTNITIPSSVTSIGAHAFNNCTSLTNIIVSFANTAYKSINGNLYSYYGTTLIQYAIGKTDTSFKIPDSVTSIGNAAFSNCTSLTSITISDSVTSIGFSAFEGCRSLISITIPDRVASIGFSAFSYCTSLTRVSILSNIISVGSEIFRNCRDLQTIYCRTKKPLFGFPKGWNKNWLGNCKAQVIWNYKG